MKTLSMPKDPRRSDGLLRTAACGLALGLALAGAACPVAAQDDDQDEGSGWLFPRAVAPDNHPDMAVKSGLLTRGLDGCWLLGSTPLLLTTESRVAGPGGAPAILQEGRRACVMGTLQGGVLVIHYAALTSAERSLQRTASPGQPDARAPVQAADDLPQ